MMEKKAYVLLLVFAMVFMTSTGCGYDTSDATSVLEAETPASEAETSISDNEQEPQYVIGQVIYPAYTQYEPGHWDQTNILFFGPNEETRQEDGMTISAGRDENQNIVYTFTSEDGSQAVCTVGFLWKWLKDFYYASDYVRPNVYMTRTAEPENAPGFVTASLAIGYIEPDEGDSGVNVDVQKYFKALWKGSIIERFTIDDEVMEPNVFDDTRYDLEFTEQLPEGESDGDKIYIILSVMDGSDGTTRMYTAWEYTWAAEPETIEVPEQEGPIEEFEIPAP